MSQTPVIDARGLRCPWPALRLARALREGDSALLLADDPAAPREVAALARERGWRMEERPEGLYVARVKTA